MSQAMHSEVDPQVLKWDEKGLIPAIDDNRAAIYRHVKRRKMDSSAECLIHYFKLYRTVFRNLYCF